MHNKKGLNTKKLKSLLMKRRAISDKLAWVAFGIVIIYFFLKILGVIHSPISIDIIALLSGAFFVGQYAHKMDICFDDVGDIKEDIRSLDKRCPIFEKRGTKSR